MQDASLGEFNRRIDMTKKQLKQRILDICTGAGYLLIEEDEYFEYDLEALGRAIYACKIRFNIGDSISFPWRMKEFESLDTFVSLVEECITYDSAEE